MKINGNIVSCAGNFALRARCKWRGELRTPCSLQGCAGNFALRARCKWRGELRASRSLQVARQTVIEIALQLDCGVGIELRISYYTASLSSVMTFDIFT